MNGMAVLLNVLENIISAYYSFQGFTQVLAITTTENFIVFCTRQLFLINLLVILQMLSLGRRQRII